MAEEKKDTILPHLKGKKKFQKYFLHLIGVVHVFVSLMFT